MLYHLIKYLSLHFDIPGAGMFLSLSFRAAMGIILALVIGMIFGKRIIRMLQRRQIGEEIRNLVAGRASSAYLQPLSSIRQLLSPKPTSSRLSYRSR